MATAGGCGTTITLDDVIRHTRQVLERVEAGDTLVVTRKSEPILEIRPITRTPAGPRPYGLAAGRLQVPDDFDDPLPEDVIAAFVGP